MPQTHPNIIEIKIPPRTGDDGSDFGNGLDLGFAYCCLIRQHPDTVDDALSRIVRQIANRPLSASEAGFIRAIESELCSGGRKR